jgi:transposase
VELRSGLAQYLVGQGETVYDVNPRWTATERRRARKPGKSDRLDAHAIAAFVQREAQTLAPVPADDETAVIDLLVTERDGVLAEATRLRNQLHQVLLQLEPSYATTLRQFRTEADLAALDAYLTAEAEPEEALRTARIAAARRLADRLRVALLQAQDLQVQIETRARPRFAPLTQLCGISLLTAGALAGILGPGQRFTSDAQLAALAGVAPLEASSAGGVRHRLNRGGNRRLNAILYRIALTQRRSCPKAQAYLARRLQEGKTLREALRALKRFLIRAIWRLWQACFTQEQAAAAA